MSIANKLKDIEEFALLEGSDLHEWRDKPHRLLYEMKKERDQLRKFLEFEPNPGPGAWAWCCHCQESHPIDQPHIPEDEHKGRMDVRLAQNAKIRELEAEIERLAKGDFTDKSIRYLMDKIDKNVEFVKRLKGIIAQLKEVMKPFALLANNLDKSWRDNYSIHPKMGPLCPTVADCRKVAELLKE